MAAALVTTGKGGTTEIDDGLATRVVRDWDDAGSDRIGPLGGGDYPQASAQWIVYNPADVHMRNGVDEPVARRDDRIAPLSYVPDVATTFPDWRFLVCSAPFTWPCEWALAVIECESGGNAGVQGQEGALVFNGLFQVWNGPFDPYLNAVEAHIQYWQWQRGERGRPWPNCG
jgi:hypothetical protein